MAQEGGTGLRTSALIEKGIAITRTFAAPQERVWKAWTEPAAVRRWWGPRHFTSPDCRIDLRIGGRYLFCMRAPDGQDFWSTGTYREIVPFSRLVCTDAFSDEAGNIISPLQYGMEGDWPPELLVTLTLRDLGRETELTLVHEGIPVGEMRALSSASWNESFDKLSAWLR